MPKKRDYPKYFSAHFPPSFGYSKPEKTIVSYKDIATIEIGYDEEILPEHVGFVLDYVADEGYRAYFIKREKTEMPNPQYDYELLTYNAQKDAHDIKLEEWHILKKKWDAELAEETKANELKQLEKLKKKYENS